MVCEVAVAGGARRFQLVIAERMAVRRRVGESGSHNRTAFWGMRDREPACVLEHERDSRLGIWIHAAHRLG